MPCPKCRDDGFYYTVPDGVNPFLLGAEGVARVATRVKCNCGAYCQDIGGGRCRYEADHIPKKAALDSSMWCIKCAAYLGEAS